MTAASKLRGISGVVAAFNPETSITWHSLFWAEGTDFVAEGYSDTDPVGTWPNETGEADAAHVGPGQPLYEASNSDFNNQPTVDFDGAVDGRLLKTADFSAAPTYPISLVLIFRLDTNASTQYVVDGNDSGNRSLFLPDTSNWRTSQAGTPIAGGTVDTSTHLAVSYLDSNSGGGFLEIDGAQVATGNSGTSTLDGLTIGALYTGGSEMDGHVALIGIYEGDITADGSWADFETWAETHYGITEATPFLGAPFQWEHAYDAAGPNMSGTYSDGDPVTGAWLDEVSSFNPARAGGGTITYKGAAPAGDGFFGTIGMLREYWAEDPSWTNPGDGVDMVSWRDNGSFADDASVGTFGGGDEPTFVASGIGSKPSIRFNGAGATTVGGYLATANGTNPNTGWTVVVVGQTNQTGSTRDFIDGYSSSTERCILGPNSSAWRLYHRSPASAQGGTADTADHLFVGRVMANDLELFVDGVSVGTDVAVVVNTFDGFTVGANWNRTDNALDGDVAYVALYAGDLTVHADYNSYVDNLMTYYGISPEGIGGRPSLDFDGTGYFESDLGASLTQPHSVVTVAKRDALEIGYIVDGATADRHTQYASSGDEKLYSGANLVGAAWTTAARVTVTVADGTSSVHRMNGVTGAVGNAGTFAFRQMTIAGNRDSEPPFTGQIAAVGVYDGDVTLEAGFAEWESEVMTHYGITPPTDGGFFGSIGMFHEFWAEDPSWSPPADAADVTTWRNNGSNGTAATEVTKPPSYSATGGPNSKPAIEFDRASAELLTISAGDTASLSQVVTYVVVLTPEQIPRASATQLVMDNDTASGSRIMLRVAVNSTDLQMYAGTTYAVGATLVEDAPTLLVAVYDGSSSYLVQDGSAGSTGNAGTSALDGFKFSHDGADSLDGKIAYAAVYDGDLTAHGSYASYIHNLSTYYGI